MHDLDKVNLALDQIQKAEQARVLWQLLVKILDLPQESNVKDVVGAINKVAKQENEAIMIIADTQRNMKKETEAEQTAVS